MSNIDNEKTKYTSHLLVVVLVVDAVVLVVVEEGGVVGIPETKAEIL